MAIELKPHNVETLKKVKEKYKESRRVAIVHPTGTGKSIIALKLIEENKAKKAIYIAPSNSILHNVKKDIFEAGMNMTHFPNLKRMTYQKLAKLTEKEIQKLGADLIILDEFHHCGAEKWGSGVERLLDRNPEANILGLSATPIRYFDGLRDMSDELFDGNVASEMTLEEAIVKGILPKAKYVSALYGYEEELKNILQKIEKIKDPEKRKQAEELFDRMSKRLSEETKNLPQLLANNMTNKSGKYIVFCKNIDDMREKKEQAQKMFGQVNSNITVRSVSSDEDIKKNERMLSEFEKDSEDGSLKLLFAVNMLNEGYHIKDLDGVVMMRPTYSPTIYAQQLGRALSVGNGKEPVIIDLVNNFDSCKIIEDFAERMKQYESTGEKRKDNSKAKSRLSIFDKTQEFRNIAQKITDILSTTKVSLEDKINIFEEFLANNEEEITSTTMYEGYPIGQWAIQIRSSLKRNDNSINPTDGQLERLEELGILESQIESTIDEKIERMAEWVKKYPYARLVNLTKYKIISALSAYTSTDEEYEKMLEEYKKMQSYYDYARVRKSKGKLTDDKLETLKNANIGGVFGYSDEIEGLAKKYGYDPEDVFLILEKYGSINNLHKLYFKRELENDMDALFVSSKFNNSFVDLDGNLNSKAYNQLVKAIAGNPSTTKIFTYSSEEIKKAIEKLTPREKMVIERRFDITGEGLPRELESVGQDLKITRERTRQVEAKALRKLRYSIDITSNIFELNDLKELMTEEEKKEYCQLDDNIIDVLLEIKTPQDEEVKRDFDFLKKVIIEFEERKVMKIQEEQREKIEAIKNGEKPIEELWPFDQKIVQKLNKLDIKSIYQFASSNKREIMEKTGLDPFSAMKIIDKLTEYGLYVEKPDEIRLEKLGLSVRSYNCLKRAGFDTIDEVKNLTEEDLLKIRNLGRRHATEVMKKIENYQVKSQDTQEHVEPKTEQDAKENSVPKSKGAKMLEMTVEEILEKIEPYRKMIEAQTEEGDVLETEQKSTDLQSVKTKRDELQEMINQLKSQMNQAQSLLDECNNILGENQKDKKPNLDD